MTKPLVTIVIPSYNQAQFLDEAISSAFTQNVAVEVFVMDGGSTDHTVEVIKKWAPRLSGWRSRKDNGQGDAINEGVAMGSASYIYWLNSDDYLLPDKLGVLVDFLEKNPNASAAYGRVWNEMETTKTRREVWVEPFNEARLAKRCIISQPGALIRRAAWDAVGGLDVTLDMVMDYDLWWRLFKQSGLISFVDEYIAVNRDHVLTKTNRFRNKHYQEAIATVRKHYGAVPLKWYIYQPYAVWFKSLRYSL